MDLWWLLELGSAEFGVWNWWWFSGVEAGMKQMIFLVKGADKERDGDVWYGMRYERERSRILMERFGKGIMDVYLDVHTVDVC